jgi:hypothetical protein
VYDTLTFFGPLTAVLKALGSKILFHLRTFAEGGNI